MVTALVSTKQCSNRPWASDERWLHLQPVLPHCEIILDVKVQVRFTWLPLLFITMCQQLRRRTGSEEFLPNLPDCKGKEGPKTAFLFNAEGKYLSEDFLVPCMADASSFQTFPQWDLFRTEMPSLMHIIVDCIITYGTVPQFELLFVLFSGNNLPVCFWKADSY